MKPQPEASTQEVLAGLVGILHQRFVDLLSHGKYSMYEPTEMGDDTNEYFLTILRGFVERHPFNRELLPEPAADTETA